MSSALSIPPWSDPIQQDLAPHRDKLLDADDFETFDSALKKGIYKVGDLLI